MSKFEEKEEKPLPFGADFWAANIEAKFNTLLTCEEFVEKTFDNFEPRFESAHQAKEVIIRFFNDGREHRKKGEGLTIAGPKGVGKTHLLVAIKKLLIERKVFAPLISCLDLCVALHKAKRQMKGEDEFDIIRRLSKIPVLLIDDWLRGTKSFDKISFNEPDWPMLLYHLINLRYQDRRPTFLTTNFKYPQMAEWLGKEGYGDFIVDRIQGRNGKIVWLSGESQRL